jgi:hypothetical protein
MVPFVILLLIAPPLFMAPSDAYVPSPTISVDILSPRTIVIELPVNASRQFQFVNNVTMNDPGHIPVDVNLTIDIEDGWLATVVPEHMTFNATGKQKVVITVRALIDMTKDDVVEITFDAMGRYSGGENEAATTARIYITYHHAVEVNYRFVKKEQYMNQVDFELTNKGNGQEILLGMCVCYTNDVEVSFTPFMSYPSLNGPPAKVSMVVQYRGSKFPMTYDLQIRFRSEMFHMTGQDYYVDTNVTVSFTAPDTTQQNYLFVGAIGAFVIVMVVVLVIVLRGPGKGKK